MLYVCLVSFSSTFFLLFYPRRLYCDNRFHLLIEFLLC
uniref:Uncharacterized protein n=1 Tax=Arundo donax TaxID=35708 RepID=A0A0A8ZEE1_ARUDO